MRSAARAIKPLRGASDPRHGTLGGYNYWGCRCDKCREASTTSVREIRRSGGVEVHSRYGYDMGCRCEKCSSDKRKCTNKRNEARREWKRTHQSEGKIDKVDLSNLA